MTNILPAQLDIWQSTLNWQPSAQQQQLFQTLYEQIIAGNKQLNLTRLTEPEEFWEKHLWDSLSGLAPWLSDGSEISVSELSASEGSVSEVSGSEISDSEISDSEASEAEASTAGIGTLIQAKTELDDDPEPLKIIDIGTGGGFPGIPAAIALSSEHPVALTLLDATRKKIVFLQTLCHQLDLKQLGINVTCIADRAEALGRAPNHREAYDLALIRAVGSAATCAEYAMPFLKPGGQAVIYRGQWTPAETEALIPVVELLGGELTDVQSWQTPLTQSSRHCLFIHKAQPIHNDFPRAIGVPGKSPLV